MIRRYVTRAAAEGPFEGEVPPEVLRGWMGNFPANAVRRMTRLGLMLGAALRGFTIGTEDAVIYATTFGETVAIARYLESFPTASPLHFQTSIHPRAIAQVLINRACPVRELTPLAGQPDLSAQAAMTALLTPGPRVLLTGGEEVGSWMRQLDAASSVGFAFALELGPEIDPATPPPADAVGEMCWRPAAVESEDARSAAATLPTDRPIAPEPILPGPVAGDLNELFSAVHGRQALRCPSPAGGEITLSWF